MTLLTPPPTTAKARGAFYTPAVITAFLAEWAIRSPDYRVLEPSAGAGAFVTAAAARFRELGQGNLSKVLVAVEREAAEATKVRVLVPDATVLASDFFDVSPTIQEQFDAVLGNPPYIRFHGFTGVDRARARGRARDQGVELSELASSWAHFVAHSVGFLRPDGRLALVLPAELLHADYAHPIRQLLSARFRSVTLIAFDQQVFPDAQVDAILLLAAPDGVAGYRIIRVTDTHALSDLRWPVSPADEPAPLRIAQPERWSAALEPDAAAVYERLAAGQAFFRLGDRARVDIGFVSGSDDYFVPSSARARELGLPPDVLVPAIRRPGDIRGLVVRFEEASALFRPIGATAVSHAAVAAYLESGENSGVSERYKCRVRHPWYVVPLQRTRPDAFLPYMNHRAPRLIVNAAHAWSTNLLHGVRLRDPSEDIRLFAAAMTSSATLLSAEIEGRSYGGGVLKLETREAERLLVANPGSDASAALRSALPTLNRLIRNGDLEAAARVTDEILGLDHDRVWNAYVAYRSRRLGRRKARTSPSS